MNRVLLILLAIILAPIIVPYVLLMLLAHGRDLARDDFWFRQPQDVQGA